MDQEEEARGARDSRSLERCRSRGVGVCAYTQIESRETHTHTRPYSQEKFKLG